MSVSPMSHAVTAQSRLTGLYADKARWSQFVTMVASAFDDLEAVLATLTRLDDIDARDGTRYLNGGVNLDVLGARLGQPRRITNSIPVLLFGWDDDVDALPWGEDDGELTGGSWYEDGQATASDALLDDASYRVVLRLRRAKNVTKALSLDSLVSALMAIFPDATTLGPYALVLTETTGTVLFGLGRQPQPLELALLKYSGAFPKPAGVAIGGYWWTTGSPTFAFDDDSDPDAAGWAEESDPDAGGVFTEEF